jgi:hypothetical protein
MRTAEYRGAAPTWGAATVWARRKQVTNQTIRRLPSRRAFESTHDLDAGRSTPIPAATKSCIPFKEATTLGAGPVARLHFANDGLDLG